MYRDPYANLYQEIAGFKIKIFAPKKKFLEGYLSLTPSTRSTYDIAMRDATIDGLITMKADDIDLLKPSQIFYKEEYPDELFILQSVNTFEHQYYTRNINAIKQNSLANVQRYIYNEETGENEYTTIYEDLISFITMQNKDEKNFQAGTEDNTVLSIQVPKRDIEGKTYDIQTGDRIIVRDTQNNLSRKIKIENVDEFGVPGVIRIFGTYDTRTGD